MKVCGLILILILLQCGNTLKAQNRYDVPANAPIINTYVPMSHEEMMLRAAATIWQQKQAQECFNRYSQAAYDCLKNKKINCFINYARAALDTGYYNVQLYYNIGISYCLLGKLRKGKKYLKKASKEYFRDADQALSAIKKKKTLSYSWFILNI